VVDCEKPNFPEALMLNFVTGIIIIISIIIIIIDNADLRCAGNEVNT
jgi:hypothetical protein